LSHASGFTGSIAEVISEDTRGGGLFGVLAGSAGELEAVSVRIFFWVEHIRTGEMLACVPEVRADTDSPFTAETESDLFQVLLWLVARARFR
jgi:hypothetical protein